MTKHRILIAGAGIGGLTAGASLLQAGHDVTIFEQASELSEVGAGLQISANATHVLHHLGLGVPLAQVGETFTCSRGSRSSRAGMISAKSCLAPHCKPPNW